MKLPIPKGLERRLRPAMTRGERFLREWEWTWTAAFIAGLGIALFALVFLAVIPSFWIYYAANRLRWTEPNRLMVMIRDAIALGWLTVWAGFFVVTAYQIQVIRRRLRGERQSDRYSGGYR